MLWFHCVQHGNCVKRSLKENVQWVEKVKKAFCRCYDNALFMIRPAPLCGGRIDFWPRFAIYRVCAFCVGGSQLAECNHPQLDVLSSKNYDSLYSSFISVLTNWMLHMFTINSPNAASLCVCYLHLWQKWKKNTLQKLKSKRVRGNNLTTVLFFLFLKVAFFQCRFLCMYDCILHIYESFCQPSVKPLSWHWPLS